jgi:hypothetical protein
MKIKHIFILIVALSISLQIVSASRMDVALQNRTINNTNVAFNEYVKIVSDTPFTMFQFNLIYDNTSLKMNYFRVGDMFQWIPAGYWTMYNGGGWNRAYGAVQDKEGDNNYYGGAIYAGNRSSMFTTYGTFNFIPRKSGTSYIQLQNVGTMFANNNSLVSWNSAVYEVVVK